MCAMKVSSSTPLQCSVTASLMILIVNMEADVSVVNMSLAVDLIFFIGEARNSLEMLEEGCGIMWQRDQQALLQHCWNFTGVGQISSISIWNYWQNTCLHEYTCIRMIQQLRLYKHAMHLYLRCVQRHIKGSWFPQTDPPLCGMPWHYKQASWRRRASVIVARDGGTSSRCSGPSTGWLCLSACLW